MITNAVGHRPSAVAVARRQARARQIIGRVLTHMILISGGLALMIPFFWMLTTSLKTPDQVFVWPIVWIPNPVMFTNYPEVFTLVPFFTYIRNSVLVTGLGIFGNVGSSALVAYSFARLRFRGRNVLFIVMLSTMMIPSWVTLVPTFILFRVLGWLDTFFPLFVPGFFSVPFFVFLLRQFFMTIPFELQDEAKIDGCGPFGILWYVILPLSAPALATVAIFSFMNHWNDFMGPLIYLRTEDHYTLALGLRLFQQFYGGGSVTRYELLMAASTMALIPCLLLFFFAQRLFIQGIVITGLKG